MKAGDAHRAADHRASTLFPKLCGLPPPPCLLPGAGHFFSAPSPACPRLLPHVPRGKKVAPGVPS